MQRKPMLYLMLAVIAGLIGFGGDLFGIPSLLDLSAFLPETLDGLVIGVSKLLAMFLTLFFVLSVCFGKRLRDRHS
jgi:uncharacterized membrane protein YtjA (UPF0391 family)